MKTGKTLPPMNFDQIVTEEVKTSLAKYGFSYEEAFHLYKNQVVSFARYRSGIKECIEFCRRSYKDEEVKTINDEIESPRQTGQGVFWLSRHYVGIQFLSNTVFTDLLQSGKIGVAEKGQWWYFTDESDLRLRLREILPLALEAGIAFFDDTIDSNIKLRENRAA